VWNLDSASGFLLRYYWHYRCSHSSFNLFRIVVVFCFSKYFLFINIL
jgi:hypothetical protein